MSIEGVPLFNMLDCPYVVKAADMERTKNILDRLDELHLKTDIVSALLSKALLLELVALF